MFFKNAGDVIEKKIHIRKSCPEGTVIYYGNSDTPAVGSYISDMSRLHNMPATMHRFLK